MAKAKQRKQKLKVFRTPIGFHDAYVAAPSQKAALEAWGASSNLFAGGAAEQVDDPKLMKAALDRPGEVIRVLRGSAEEQVKALRAGRNRSSPRPSPAGGRGRKPSRAELDRAEAAVAELAKAHEAELRALAKQEEELARRRREAQRRHEAEHDEAAAARDSARARFERAMRQWEKGR